MKQEKVNPQTFNITGSVKQLEAMEEALKSIGYTFSKCKQTYELNRQIGKNYDDPINIKTCLELTNASCRSDN